MAVDRNADALQQTREALKEQTEILERLAKAPLIHGTVIHVGKKRLTISRGGELLDVEPCQFALKAGDCILLDPEGGQILEKREPLSCGEPLSILRVIDSERAEVATNGTNKIIFTGEFTLKEGDEVILDSSSRVVIHKVKETKPRFAVTQETTVTWDSIGGQHEAKAAMREMVELPFKAPGLFKSYGKKPAKGILLSGPTGCGKTMLGKAAATAIQSITGGTQSGFMYIKGPEILDPYVGVAEAAVRKIFQRAKEHKSQHGSPAVVFIDEADAVLGKRGTHNAFMEKTIVPAFLTEMDGMEDSGAMIILATNRPDTLDPAVVRDGRIDRKIKVTRPSLEDCANIFGLYLKNLPIQRGESADDLAAIGAAELFRDSRVLYHLTVKGGLDTVAVPLSALVSGAMVAGIVEKAVSRALHRDLKSDAKRASGISHRDIVSGVVMTHRENVDIDHSDIIHDVTGGAHIIHARRGAVPELEAA